ncbi:MAG: beta-lactamase family protein [Verrucomicrobiales bacterium]|nr:beta-lactamase family protein [Verrucomicrobiales bacterium]
MQDSMEKAAALIQTEVDSGTLESAVLDVRRGSFSFSQAFGKAASADAIFLLASITKPMAAAGVMLLADRGELKLSDQARKFIPEFSEGDRKDITIEQLLIHTSGLPDQLPENADLRKAHSPLSEFVKAAIHTPLLFKPGTKYSYQSMGILLLAEIAERITQTPFPNFLADEIFTPLGMNRTALGLGKLQISDTIRCQTQSAAAESGAGAADTKSWDWNSEYWRKLGSPWGGAHGSAGDVATFLQSFLKPDGKVLRKETAHLMIQNHTEGLESPRGLGFDLATSSYGESCSPKTFGHRGATGTLAWADPETDLSCVILTSLPLGVSEKSLLKPVSNLVSAAA